MSELEQVFQAWQQRQVKPERCLLSQVRETRLKKLLKTYKPAELILVIHWVYESEDERAVFLRTKGYTDLIEIFRFEKLDARLEMAQAWEETESEAPLLSTPRSRHGA